VYRNGTIPGEPIGNINFAADSIALSANRSTLYFSTAAGRELPTARLRDNGPYSELLANGAVQYLGQKGLSDWLEMDSSGLIYCGNMEDNSIVIFQTTTGTVEVFVRDPRFSETDTMSVATDGYLYFTENQLWRGPGYNGGVDKRVKPFCFG